MSAALAERDAAGPISIGWPLELAGRSETTEAAREATLPVREAADGVRSGGGTGGAALGCRATLVGCRGAEAIPMRDNSRVDFEIPTFNMFV